MRIATGFDRPNLSFAVVPCPTKEAGHRAIAAALAEPGALPAIVYAGTRAECDRLAGRLTHELATTVLPYHAGLARDVRAEAQRRFMDGEVDVVVATNAFGMGVDKADVRTVCHEAVPGSLEAYYQEAGRAGRDGAPARCLLFAVRARQGPARVLHRALDGRGAGAQGGRPRADGATSDVAVAGGQAARFDVPVERLAALAGCDEEVVRAIVGHLARIGVVQPSPSAPDRVLGRVTGVWDGRALALSRSAAQEGTRARWRQYRAVWSWVEGTGCRRAGILRHFGDAQQPAPTGPCCDVCDPALAPALPAVRGGGGSGGPRQLAQRPVADGDVAALDEAIVEVVALARPSLGRTRAVEVLRGGALEGAAQARLGRAAPLRHVRPPERPVGAGARRRAARGRDDTKPAAATTRCWRRREGRRPRVRRGLEPAGDPRPRARPRRRRGRGRRLGQARCPRA